MKALLIAALLSAPISDRPRVSSAVDSGGACSTDLDLDTYKLYGDYSADPNTYISRTGADEWTITAGGTAIGVYNATTCTCAGALAGVTSLDATTETTVESAIDFLPNLTGLTFTAPTTSTVAANATTCNFAAYDICKVDLQGSTGTVTLTLSGGRLTGNLIEIIQGDNADDVTFSPGLYAAGGTGPAAVSTTEDAVDWLFVVYDGSNYIFTGQYQDIQAVP